MSDKALCRKCEVVSSRIETAAYDGDPCPICGADNSHLVSQAERDGQHHTDQQVGTTVEYSVRLPDGRIVSHRMGHSFKEALAYKERLCGEAEALGVVDYSVTIVTRSIVRTRTISNWIPVTDEVQS